MKSILLFIFLSFNFTLSNVELANAKDLYSDYDFILNKYVSNGLVDYKSLKNNRKPLDDFLTSMSKIGKQEFNAWNKDMQLAYLINLYNAQTLKLIIDNYPVDSIKDIGSLFKSPWSLKIVPLFGENVTLDTIEHDIIRVDYKEPRIHLALVCAAISCPPLRSEAYRAEKLSQQLDDQGKIFFNSTSTKQNKKSKGLKIDDKNKTLYLSSILKWYKEDFDSVEVFVRKYVNNLPFYYKIDWLDYNWNLNKQN